MTPTHILLNTFYDNLRVSFLYLGWLMVVYDFVLIKRCDNASPFGCKGLRSVDRFLASFVLLANIDFSKGWGFLCCPGEERFDDDEIS
ncbi:hypothetical protein G4B88_028405 [Cannabis sativa]|uniref:Uncharacterized protein n=1 Tax=Cannabis sativa TaxID=3483 RepID=A0A7J6F111_CANSA|nr:hypothetical protein G4B88_028405 [Cannabis sativa]